jgi:hypothetical protein
MMQLKDTWQKILETGFPAGLHGKVMRRIFLLKYRGVFLALGAAVATYFFFAGWELWAKLIDGDFFASFQALTEGINFDITLIFDALSTAAGLIPSAAALNFLVSAIFVGFAGWELKKYKLFYK